MNWITRDRAISFEDKEPETLKWIESFDQKNLGDIKPLAGRGAWIMMQRSFKEEIKDEKVKKDMLKEFINYYANNIDKASKPINGVLNFLKWAQSKKIPMAVCTNKQEKLAVDLLNKIKLAEYFHYIAGCDTSYKRC